MPNSPTTAFPLYLFPSIPFRRRRSSQISTSTISDSPAGSPPQPTSFLASHAPAYLSCQKCLCDLVPTTSIISKGFTGRHGRAYLVAPPLKSHPFGGGDMSLTGWSRGDLPNTSTHKAVPRQLVTGAHTVSDISCRNCGTVLGWKYVEAAEETQKYKVGKFILETKRVVKSAGSGGDFSEHGEQLASPEMNDDDIHFDSQDEDECEDLFSGIWTPQLARRRRNNRRFTRVE